MTQKDDMIYCSVRKLRDSMKDSMMPFVKNTRKSTSSLSTYACVEENKKESKQIHLQTWGTLLLMDLRNVVSIESLNFRLPVTGASPNEESFLFGGLMFPKVAWGSWGQQQ